MMERAEFPVQRNRTLKMSLIVFLLLIGAILLTIARDGLDDGLAQLRRPLQQSSIR